MGREGTAVLIPGNPLSPSHMVTVDLGGGPVARDGQYNTKRSSVLREEPEISQAISEAFPALQPHVCKGLHLPLQPGIG